MTLLIDTPPGGTGLIVQRCGLWHYNAIGVVSGDEACAIDPGITPEEIATLRAALEAGGRRVTHVVLTHSHHDHIRGWSSFGDATIVAPEVVAQKTERPRARILAGKSVVDQRMGVVDPEFEYPEIDVTFKAEHTLQIGELELRLKFLPGHSDCTSVVHVPALRALLTADYLVSPGLPYCRWEAAAFEGANRDLREMITEQQIELVVPAHNDLIRGQANAASAVDEELSYFRDLRADVRSRVAAGTSKERVLRESASHMGERRGVDLGARARQDADNARRVLAEESEPGSI